MYVLIEVKVTPEDIENGIRGDCSECPIARSLMRIVNQPVSVGPDWISIGLKGLYGRATPWRATEFIRAFDHNMPVTPFSFDLAIPAELLRSNADGQG